MEVRLRPNTPARNIRDDNALFHQWLIRPLSEVLSWHFISLQAFIEYLNILYVVGQKRLCYTP